MPPPSGLSAPKTSAPATCVLDVYTIIRRGRTYVCVYKIMLRRDGDEQVVFVLFFFFIFIIIIRKDRSVLTRGVHRVPPHTRLEIIFTR